MQTKPQIETKIAELEAWLQNNSSEHEARSIIAADLRKLKEQLSQPESHRTIERDTFDLRDHNFHSNHEKL